ncbi:MAG: SatD family protein [Lachnospiraceae bacterium]|nr:SatD family protein [bacterium]MDY5517778.1 SatD family protein [Lachnospiraceae bacterium]
MNYIAIIGDIKNSKMIDNRCQVQERLYEILKQINEMFDEDIAAKFVITLGDEFQGLLKSVEHLFYIIKYIQREMYPVRLRFGIGLGEVWTNIFCEAAIGADGPAYYAARSAIVQLREQEKKFKKQAVDIQISIYDTQKFEIEEINTMLALMKIIEDSWSDKQRFTIWDMEQNGGSQEECAKRMNTTQSTIARRLAEGNYLTYERAKKTVEKAFRRLQT